MWGDIEHIISALGFPIFAFLICIYALKYLYDTMCKRLDSSVDMVKDLTIAVNNNTEAIRALVLELNKESEE